MSMHFAPQWVKPIKPTGPTATTGDVPPPSARGHQSTPSHPFPALNPGRSSSPSTVNHNPALSYSKITHAQSPQSPGFASDGAGPATNGENGNGHPFRYSKEFMISLWNQDKVKEVPIELAGLMETAALLVSNEVVKPIGMRDLGEIEKKLLATSVHPTNPLRTGQRMANDRPDRVDRNDREQANGHVIRRPIPPPTTGKDSSAAPGSGRGAFGGFGRGEGGAFGGGKTGTIGGGPLSAGLETRGPGTMGGGFGGVSKRLSRRTDSSDLGADAATGRVGAPWRSNKTASGTFEGVLGFNQTSSQPTTSAEIAPIGSAPGWRERQEKDRLEKERVEKEKTEDGEQTLFGRGGGGPGWGGGQKKWRMAAGIIDGEKTIELPVSAPMTESVMATAAGTPVPDRDATVSGESAPPAPAPPQTTQEKEDLGAVEWFYRDPAGDEQGPFSGTQMQDWYAHAYFVDDLCLRRASNPEFMTLIELKSATGNGVQPFLSAIRPRLPPNLPVPASALPLHSPGMNGHTPDAFRNLSLHTGPQQPFNQYMPDRMPFSANQFGQFGQPQIQSPGFGSPAAAAPWGGLPQRGGDAFGMRSPFGDHFGGAPQPYSPAPGAPIYPQHQMPYGVPPPNPIGSPWGVPGMPQNGPMPMYNQAPGQPMHAPMPDQYAQAQVQQQQQQQQQPPQQMEPPRQVQEQRPSEEPSYFPEGETAPTPEPEQSSIEESAYEAAKIELGLTPKQDSDPLPVETVEKTPAAPPASVWGNVTPRKQSIASSTPVIIPPPTTSSKTLPPAPSSLPPRPTTQVEIPTPKAPAAPETPSAPTPITPAAKSTPPAAPWAAKEDRPSTPTGPSLREIQDAEAKVADLRRAALTEARASAQTPTASSEQDQPSNMSWGLPTAGSGKNGSTPTPAPGPASPAAPAWGSGEAGPKKTLKQIQEEEERRKKAVQAASAAKMLAAGGGVGGVSTKRGYADLAANTSTPPAGWSTVGLGGKVIPGAAPKPAGISIPTKPISTTPIATPSKPTPNASVATPSKKSDDLLPPSAEFMKWVKTALTGLKTPPDDFIQMLLTFPVDPPASTRPELLEIISDSVYANSATLDGRRFASEFYEKRKLDAKRGKSNGSTGAGGYSLADVVKSQPAKKEDVGFKIVKAKGKKKN